LSETSFLEKIIAPFAVWKHNNISVEDIAFQDIYKNNLMEKATLRKICPPIADRKTSGISKEWF
jgi:hypothetical protein